jgi:hypothetical protein
MPYSHFKRQQEALWQAFLRRHSAGCPDRKKPLPALSVQGWYAAMYAGIVAAGTQQGGGRYAVPHTVQNSHQNFFFFVSRKMKNSIHDLHPNKVIFMDRGAG